MMQHNGSNTQQLAKVFASIIEKVGRAFCFTFFCWGFLQAGMLLKTLKAEDGGLWSLALIDLFYLDVRRRV